MEFRPPESEAAGAAATAVTGVAAAGALVTGTLAATVVAAPVVVVFLFGMMMGSVRLGESPGRVTVAGATAAATVATAAALVDGAAVVATGAAADVVDLRGAKFSELGGRVYASRGNGEVDADPADDATFVPELPSVPELSFSSSSEKVAKGSQLVRSELSVFE